MDSPEIVARRLRSQHAVAPFLARPQDVVRSLGAVQAQDYKGSLWAIGRRTTGPSEASVERAIAERSIVRTWPLRGTLHFVPPEDVRWMLRWLTPRVFTRAAGRHRELGLDAQTFARSRRHLEKALAGGRTLSRPEMYQVLERAGITTAGQRGIHILLYLAMQGVLCLGPRLGLQPAFVLLDEWIPESGSSRLVLERDEALSELAARYVRSRGPATVHDFAWWSGLSLRDARRSISAVETTLVREEVGAHVYLREVTRASLPRANGCQLLPAFDEYTVAYRDRSAVLDASHAARAGNGISTPVVLLDGRIGGTWKRGLKGRSVVINVALFSPPTSRVERALDVEVARYGVFLDRTPIVALARG